MIEPPVHPTAEAVVAVIKGLVASVPVVGGVASELGGALLNPIERRQQRWMVEVSAAINAILARCNVSPDQLLEDEQFMSAVVQATQAAFRTHQAIKLQALRNAVANSFPSGEAEGEIGLQFMRYVDELTPSHLILLATIEENVGRYSTFLVLEALCASLSQDSGLSIEPATLRVFLQDLAVRFLLSLGDLEELPEFASRKSMMLREESTVRPIELTPFGRQFLKFVRP